MRARRAGYAEDSDEVLKELKALAKQPVTQRCLLKWFRDGIAPLMATYRLRIGTAHEKVAALEARVVALEARPAIEYCGIHAADAKYVEGNLVTRSGALWLALRSTSQTPGKTGDWRLVVKSGGVI